MSSHHVAHDLLFGFVALQNSFITCEDLVGAVSVWLTDKSRALDEILRTRNALPEDESKLVGDLVRRHLQRHGEDAAATHALVGGVDETREESKKLGGREIAASVAPLPEGRKAGRDLLATLPPTETEKTRFRIIRRHAKGNLGEVFVAEDLELHREVALKEITLLNSYDSDSRARFLLEAEVTGSLEHPGIVPIYGLGQYDNGRPFYAMRLIHGESLAQAADAFHASGARRDAYDSIEFRRLLGRLIDVCNAIEYAHSRGVLHRDLKPANIMLGKYGETLVVDWGMAKVKGRGERRKNSSEQTLHPQSTNGSTLTQYGAVVGTPAYMSPEQAAGDGDELGPASDVYSLGATLYYVLTGQPPFAAREEVIAVLQKVRAGEFPGPRAVRPQVPESLEAICLKAMRREPAERFFSAQALADEIEFYLAEEVESKLPSPVEMAAMRYYP